MKKIAVLEFKSQFEALLKQVNSLEEVDLYCLNPELWPYLDKQKIAYQKILDEFIQDDWKKIHVWTRETALTWFDHPLIKDLLTVRGVNLGNIILNDFRHALLQIVTNVCVVRKILKNADANSRLIIFQEVPSVKRSFFGRPELQDTINYIMDTFGKEFRIPVENIPYVTKPLNKINLRQTLRSVITNFYSFFSCLRARTKPSIAVFGGFNHLQGFMSEFCKQGIPFYIFDSTFHPSFFRKAKELNVPYVVQGSWSRIFFLNDFSKGWKWLSGGLKQIPQSIQKSGIFLFEGFDLSNFIIKHFEDVEAQFKSKLDDILFSEYLIREKKTSSLLLDEDTSFKRTYAASFNSLDRPVFVVSHGVAGGDYQINPAIKTSSYGHYFVNSEFEKEKYCTMGWDPDKILTTGVSRYDQIHGLKQKPKSQKNRKVVLYCPHRLTEKRTRAFGINTPGYVTYQNTKHVIEAVKDLDCELWIKPHADAGDVPIWNNFSANDKTGRIKTLSPSANIFELLSQSDLLVTTFSSVIIEGLLFEIPVITLNFTGRPDIHPYVITGVTCGVYQPEKLKEAISNCLENKKTREALEESRKKHFSYFCGFSDGMNSKRSVEIMMDKISKKQNLELVSK